jgi:hypothetical protein
MASDHRARDMPVEICMPGQSVSLMSASRRMFARAVRGTIEMTQDQFSAIMFHLKAMLGLVCLQAAILVGFAWKYL